MSGCASCSFPKAVRYWRDQEAKGELGEGYEGRGRGRGRARGRGRGRGRPAKAKALPGAFAAGGGQQIQAKNAGSNIYLYIGVVFGIYVCTETIICYVSAYGYIYI